MSFRYPNGYLSATYDPLKVPNAPTIGTATAGAGNASVAFTAPTDVGGSAITGYVVVSDPGNIVATGVSSPITVTGLTNGTPYTFKVFAQNSYGPSAYSASSGSVTPSVNYVEEVFSTYLYTGNGASRSIVNEIDLAGKGGLLWVKSRSSAQNNYLATTPTGFGWMYSNTLDSIFGAGGSTFSFNNNGWSTTSTGVGVNGSGETYVSWTFRKQPKFFDVVTYTGDGTSNRSISHNLGASVGMIIIKRTNGTGAWIVYHRTQPSNQMGRLQSNSGFQTGANFSSNSTTFTVSSYGVAENSPNTSGYNYVAYLFAHNAGGFGADGSQSVVSCGNYTGNGSTDGTVVTLGWEPQWVLIKSTGATADDGNWYIFDNMRGVFTGGNDERLLTNAESQAFSAEYLSFTSTGFQLKQTVGINQSSQNYIYVAIRRGPMKTPTLGTSVFQPTAFTSTQSQQTIGSLTAVDAFLERRSNSSSASWGFSPRLTSLFLVTNSTTSETNSLINENNPKFDQQNGARYTTTGSGDPFINYNFRRAPGFFDVVCYTTPGSTFQNVNHNLGATPELIIVKQRNGTNDWGVQYVPAGSNSALYLNTNDAFGVGGWSYYFSPVTSTSIQVATSVSGYSAGNFVAYLFASCPGVSKVGSYTGTGTTLQVNCGFTSGARFVLIKRTDSTGDWYVWDSARGIVAGNDPYLLLNSTAAEVTNTDYVDTYSAGFEISSTAPAGINANGGTFIYLAIA